MINPQNIRAAYNNSMANAITSGDPRIQVKQMDRGGMSRGAAQYSAAGAQGAAKMAEGIADAYSQKQQAQDYNTATSMQANQQDASQQQALGALAQQQQYNNQMAALQRQNSAMNYASSLLGGLLN
jgi:hypothetical protein